MIEGPVRGRIVDLTRGEIFPGVVHVRAGRIERVERDFAVRETRLLLPGLVDSHVHVESSMLPPAEFARLAVRHGTVAAVADPHEIANVLGVEGVRLFLDAAAGTPLELVFGAPSCVPATGFETAGAALDVAAVESLLDDPRVGFVGEVMNWPGVLRRDPEVLAKIDAAIRRGKLVDGHAPGLRGEEARAYFGAGITADHECTTLEEARDKAALGVLISIREGSAAKNLDTLLPLLDEAPESCAFCTDDSHADDLVRGHVDGHVRRALRAGYDPIRVLRAASLVPVRHYRLRAGLLREGDRADWIEVDDLASFRVLRTVLGGEVVAEDGRSLLPRVPFPLVNRFVARPIDAAALRLPARGGEVRAITARDGLLVTGEARVPARIVDGAAVADPARDLLKIVVVNRYAGAPPAVAFATGFGLRSGAIASSVAHDSHNVIAIGTSDEALVRAINAVVATRGGLSVAGPGGESVLPLPIAGLLSDRDGDEVGAAYGRLTDEARALGTPLHAPFMTLSFMALLVIPELKLSDRGLFDGRRFELVSPLVG